jgi:hypothetical protein
MQFYTFLCVSCVYIIYIVTSYFMRFCFVLFQDGEYVVEKEYSGSGLCPYDPDHNSTGVYSGKLLQNYIRILFCSHTFYTIKVIPLKKIKIELHIYNLLFFFIYIFHFKYEQCIKHAYTFSKARFISDWSIPVTIQITCIGLNFSL